MNMKKTLYTKCQSLTKNGHSNPALSEWDHNTFQNLSRVSQSCPIRIWGLVKVHGRFGTAGKELQKCPNSKPRHSAMHHFFHSGIAIFSKKMSSKFFPKVFRTQALRRVSQRATPPRCQTLRSTKPQSNVAVGKHDTEFLFFLGIP